MEQESGYHLIKQCQCLKTPKTNEHCEVKIIDFLILGITRVICDPTGSTGCLRHEGKQVAPQTDAALVRHSSQGEMHKKNVFVYLLSSIPKTDTAW